MARSSLKLVGIDGGRQEMYDVGPEAEVVGVAGTAEDVWYVLKTKKGKRVTLSGNDLRGVKLSMNGNGASRSG